MYHDFLKFATIFLKEPNLEKFEQDKCVKLMKSAYKNKVYGQSVFQSFKLSVPKLKDAPEGEDSLREVKNQIYSKALKIRGHNRGYFELKDVAMESEQGEEIADISIFIQKGLLNDPSLECLDQKDELEFKSIKNVLSGFARIIVYTKQKKIKSIFEGEIF